MRCLAVGGFLVTLTAGLSPADAHIDLLEPAVRYPGSGGPVQKSGPCGIAANEPTRDIATVLAPGATVMVRLMETIPHPGYFRIAFDNDGDDDFVDPVNADDINNNGTVLLDHWLQAPSNMNGANPDAPAERPLVRNAVYSTTVTLPEVECDNCVLQVLQIMTDKNAADVPFDGNDIYYRCANIVLSADVPDAGPVVIGPDAGPGTTDDNPDNPDNEDGGSQAISGGCTSGGNGTGALAGLLVLFAATLTHKRRSPVRPNQSTLS